MTSSHRLVCSAVIATTFASLPMLADFSYEQTTQLTGGALLSMMKFAGAFSKDGRKLTHPMPETVSVKGHRMVSKNPDSATIIDVDQETITTLDYAKRTYSVVTFEQMKQQMAAMQERVRTNAKGQGSFDVKLNDTGKTKSINGTDTREVIVTMAMSGSDEKSGSQGTMNVATDMWIAPSITGYAEARDLHRSMAEKIGWAPGQNALLNRPDVAKAMAELYKNGSKLDGMPMTSNINIGANVQSAADGDRAATANPPREQSAASQSSPGEGLANMLGGRFGLGRNKKKDNNGNADRDGSSSSPGALLEMTTNVTSFSSLEVNEVFFQVPAGFTKVEAKGLSDARSK
jgi:hypothetical protein